MDYTIIDYVDCRGQPEKFYQEPVGTSKRIKPVFDIRFFQSAYYLDGELAGAIAGTIKLNITDQRTLVVCGIMERAYPMDTRAPATQSTTVEKEMDAELKPTSDEKKMYRENPQDETAAIGDDNHSVQDAQAPSDGQSDTDLEAMPQPAFQEESSDQGEGSREKPRVYIVPQLRAKDKGRGRAKGILRKPGSENAELESDDDQQDRADFNERMNPFIYTGDRPNPSTTWVWVLAERKVGRFFRSFRFKRPINWDAAQSRFMNGLLLLRLPVIVGPKKRVRFKLDDD
ncbi:hypothetical protein M752DRAFT_28201 [Aspergillus phoenicis ATCC 13157]|uniref:SHSP domain-containing protein n=1 Tax=Aspergillus phoenicis ATCC 13157 TaxID=1353007 RepID=A0A370PHA9_ASPPH|nr:hypothetical protein M752DRAFT_28201 [Aspergillus phoenicis ATCC 13157]GLA24816.1 hypothetical protein AnigIFM63326_001101 [Aspergillus niger]